MPAGVWAQDGHLEALVSEATCTITVKAGLRGRSSSGVHVVLRVGLSVVGGSQARLRFSPEAFGECGAVPLHGVEECDIGRLSPRSDSNSNNFSPEKAPTAGACVHNWNDDAQCGAGPRVAWTEQGGGSACSAWHREAWTESKASDFIDAAKARRLGPGACSVEFGCGLALRVWAACEVRPDGQAAVRVEVEGELRLRPKFKLAGPEAAVRLYALAKTHFCGGRDLEAIELCEESLRLCERSNLVPSETGDLLNLLGALHLRRRTPSLAVKCLERALTIRRQTVGHDDAACASTHSTLGSAHQMLGSHADALRSFQRAVAILDRVTGVAGGCTSDGHASGQNGASRGDAALATTLHSLGGAHRALGQNSDARTCYERALSVRKHALGEDHPLNAATFNNLGAVLQQLLDDRGAVRCYQRALALQAKTYGHDHCMTAATLSNLGSAHERVGDHACAIDCHGRALPIQEKRLGREHPGVAATLHNLGNALAGAGRGLDAAQCHWRALAIWTKAMGPAHPDIAATLHSLGNVYRGLSQPEAAGKCFAGALRIREVALGPTHPETARTQHCAALAGCALGDHTAALPDLETAAQSLLCSLGAKHPWSLQACADADSLRKAKPRAKPDDISE